MLKLSTKGRYGLRAMIELAAIRGERPLVMSEISASQSLSRKYLHALLSDLKKAGLVVSLRGVRGGYLLARDPEDIKVSEVISALEGDLNLVDCVGDEALCGRSDDCVARNLWARASRAMVAVLESTTLAELASPPDGRGMLTRGKICKV